MMIIQCSLVLMLFTLVTGLRWKDISSTEVLSGVQEVIFIVGADDGDGNLLQIVDLAGTANATVTFRTAADGRPICENSENSLIVDSSGFILLGTPVMFGKCRWLFARSDRNLKLLADLRQENAKIYLYRDLETTTEVYEYCSGTMVLIEENPNLHEERCSRIQQRQQPHFKLAAFHTPPYIYFPQGDSKKATGFSIDIIEVLKEKFNFTYEIVPPTSGSYGTMDEHGNWNGMMEQLVKGQVDLALILQVTEERSTIIDFTQVVSHGKLALISKKASLKTSISFFKLLDLTVWIFTAIFVVAFIIAAITISIWSSSNSDEIDHSHCVLFVLGCLVNQAFDEDRSAKTKKKRLSARILLLTILLFGFLGLNFLCANLTSSISVRLPSMQIRSLLDVERNEYQLFIPGGTTIEQDFKTAEEGSVKKRIWDRQVSTDAVFRSGTFEGEMNNFLASSRSSAALLYELIYKSWAFEHSDVACSLDQILLEEGDLLFSFGARKGFPHLQLVNQHILKMRETGILDNIRRKWMDSVEMSHEYICSKVADEVDTLEVLSLGLENTKLFYVIVLCGVAVSLVTFALETCWHFATARKSKKKRRKNLAKSVKRLK